MDAELDEDGDQLCQGCKKPRPRYYCWDGREDDCPLGFPPRWKLENF